MDITQALAAISAVYDTHDFVAGNCHTLAVALYEADAKCGKLFACLRRTLNEDGSVYSTAYSHMVYECSQGRLWDIEGDQADVRWEESFPDADLPDKWGQTCDFVWVEVPYENHLAWLAAHRSNIDTSLCNRLKQLIQEAHLFSNPVRSN